MVAPASAPAAGAYLRRCREAAGLTPDAVALMLIPDPVYEPAYVIHIVRLEAGDAIASPIWLIELMRAFPLDPAAYRRLAGKPGAPLSCPSTERSIPVPDRNPTPPPAPLHPWDYLRLRRQAAGRTVGQAARPHYRAPHQRDAAERYIRTFETPHHVIRGDATVEALRRSYPLDPAVYAALRDLPPAQHPTVCRGCGGSLWDMPLNRDGTEATIGAGLICTACGEKADGASPRREAA